MKKSTMTDLVTELEKRPQTDLIKQIISEAKAGESVGTMTGWNKWRLPDDLRRRDDFLLYMKTEVLK